ncbi:MAG: hypothetical protein IKA37_07805 [Spirochaetales bacterium]|nr:hypothetical protein [Spirochaetales bacterium]
MKYKTLLLSMIAAIIVIACVPTEKEKIVEKEVIKEVEKEVEKEVIIERNTLQYIVNNTNAGETIDLSKYDNITSYTATINKQLTIKNGSLNNEMLTIEANNVELAELENLNLTTSEKLGDGKLTIKNSKLSDLLLCGGGRNSIYILGTSSVVNLTMNYQNVRTLLGNGVNVTNLIMQKDGTLQTETDGTAKIEKLIIDGISTLANIGGGSEDKNAGGNIEIKTINLNSENTQINLDGDVTADNVIANATSKIVTNNYDFNLIKASVSKTASLSTTLTIVKNAEMTPISLLPIGIESTYIVGQAIDKNTITVMEENELSGDAVIYKKDSNGTQTINKIWLKKSEFDIEIVDNNESLEFSKAGTFTIKITCDGLIYEQDIDVINTADSMGDIFVDIQTNEPKISLYISENSDNNYIPLLISKVIPKPTGTNPSATLCAAVNLPNNYEISEWLLNGQSIATETAGVLITLPLNDYEYVSKLVPGENTISVITKEKDNTALSTTESTSQGSSGTTSAGTSSESKPYYKSTSINFNYIVSLSSGVGVLPDTASSEPAISAE